MRCLHVGFALGSLVLLSAGLLACGQTTRPDGGSGLLAVGAVAPNVTGTDAKGAMIRLSDAKGKPAIVYFYPKDDTPGCTKEACAFRDAFGRFDSAGVVIFGVSRDSAASHRTFREHHKLPFPLVADESGQVQSAYGVPSKMPGIAARVSFLVDRNGKIAKVWPEVDPVLHASEVLEAAGALGAVVKP